MRFTASNGWVVSPEHKWLILGERRRLLGIVSSAAGGAAWITAKAPACDNARQQMTELIRQNYNHPSIVFLGVGNEQRTNDTATNNLLVDLSVNGSSVGSQSSNNRIFIFNNVALSPGNNEIQASGSGVTDSVTWVRQ